jgi:D-amino-acid dehydrogenase
MAGGAAFFPDARFMSDPGKMVGALAEATWALGVRHLRSRVERIARTGGGVRITGPGLALTADRVVIAAGAHSRGLARQAGDAVPLATERGYHLEYDMEVPRLSRPVCPTARGFYFCPMAGRLRVAGTVELGGLTAPPSPHRLEVLDRGARALMPDLPAPARTWMGFRPSMPDSLPVIGPSAGGGEVLHAYGHGHIGLTLAPVTAEIIAALVAGRPPRLDLAPYRVGRF